MCISTFIVNTFIENASQTDSLQAFNSTKGAFDFPHMASAFLMGLRPIAIVFHVITQRICISKKAFTYAFRHVIESEILGAVCNCAYLSAVSSCVRTDFCKQEGNDSVPGKN